MVSRDPYTAEESYYECVSCQNRTRSSDHLGSCPECGERVRNLAVTRE